MGRKRAIPRKTVRREAPQQRTPEVELTTLNDGADSEVLVASDEPEEENAAMYPIVGIGASAGGLEAFSEILQDLPANTGMGFVFVQHLDPKHASLLRDLLQRHTGIRVEEVTDGMRVEPDHLYVIPRNTQMTLVRGTLRLAPRQTSPTPNMPIDVFLRSLAADQKGKAIGVILSGNASDGTLGMMAIKASGGITFAQSGETAKYDGMPRSAVAAGSVDFVLSPREIAIELARLGQHPYIAPIRPAGGNDGNEAASPPTEAMARILALLRTTTGTDFTYYKSSTIARRIQRRMALRRIDNVDRYVAKLRGDPAEIHALHEDILINVTEFFRDPDVFDALKKIVFPKIVPAEGGGTPIRIWVPGCSSGEEVYSIAMALLEYLDTRTDEVSIQIFGTDISEAALDKARAGFYAPGIVQNVSPDRIRRFFSKVDSNYRISKRIREMCIFARQDVTKDPPFSKLHLISCRNVLIYLGAVLQKRVIPILHYALRPNGFLLLGKSESISAYTELFTLENKKFKVYLRRPGAGHILLKPSFEEPEVPKEGPAQGPPEWSDADLQHEADRIVIGKYGPAGVVVDDDLNILQFRGHTSAFLEPSAGIASLNLVKMAREGLSAELRNAVGKARRSQQTVRREGLRIRRDSGFVEFKVEVVPIRRGRTPRYLILFEEKKREAHLKAGPKSRKRMSASSLERENTQLREDLVSIKEYLQSIIEEQEASNEELRSANEEIQSSNEELQSTNEELETAKEELQSTNEELNTVNEELQNRNVQLAQSGDDLNNLLSNANIPIIMLQNDLKIRKFTPVSGRLLNLIPTDVGRPISDINLNLDVPKLDKILLEVIETLTPKTLDVKDFRGRPYSLRIRPYRTGENKIDGLVLVLVDLDTTRFEADATAARAFAERSEELQAFTAGLLISQERESQRLARELHDDFTQRLAILQMNVESMQRKPPSPDEFAEKMRSTRDAIASILEDLRRVAYRLHPATVDELGLPVALQALTDDFGKRYGIECTFQHGDVPTNLSPEVALCLYRLVQEGLRNVAEHSHAKSAEVTLTGRDKVVRLLVKDNGHGFDLDQAKKKLGLGLRSMEERVRSLEGKLEIHSGQGGTELLAEVPQQARVSFGNLPKL